MKRYITPTIFQVAAKAEMFQASNTLDKTTGEAQHGTGSDGSDQVLGKKGMWESMDDEDK